jgi:YbbR domain-containing protein
LKLTDVQIPQHSLGIKVLRIENPDTIEIRLTKIKKKCIKIEPDITIIPEAGYTKVGEICLTPDSITISGPVNEVDLINSILTEHLEIRNIRRDYSQEIGLTNPSSPLISLQNKEVNIKIHIQKLMEKEISRVPVHVYNLPEGMRAVVIPPYLNLTLEGGVQILASVSESNIVAYIDYARKKKENEIGHPAIIKTPPEVMYRDVNPKTFKLLLEKDQL